MEAPISASQGPMRSLPRKLDLLLSGSNYGLRAPEKNKIRLLQGDLRGLIDNYLLEPSEVESPSSTANSWMMEVRDLSYDIDDFIYELTGGSGGDASTSIVQKFPRVNISRFLEKLKRRQWVADEISEFRIRVKEAIRQHKVYLSNCKWRPCRSERRLPPSPCSQASFRLVGMQNSIKQLCGWLAFDEQPENRVASIVGTGGVGKTTLAKEVYRMLGGHFECLAFVRTSRKPDTKRLLASILSQVQQHQLAVADPSDVHTLVSKINAHLRYKTYLVIIDDLWALSTWDIFNHALPKGNRCSRILTTTEVDVIAQTCCADNFKCMLEKKEQNSNFMPLKTEDNSKYMPSKKEYTPPKKQVESKYIPLKGKNNPVYMPSMKEDNSRYIIKMRPLREDEARELFLSTAFGQQAECPQCIKEVSNEIIKRSGGFPLAINILARLLAGQTASSLDQWNYIKNSLSSSLTSNSNLEGINHVLNLGYDDLPHGLKACMLYLCLYEEDCVIWKDDLVKQWIAEGFICAEEGDDGEEVAQSYFDELVIRGMIQSVDINCNGEILSCRVHHMVFNFIRYKSIEENFSIAIDYSQNVIRHADKVRRLALHFSNVGDATLPALASMRLSKIRSVAFFGFLKCMPSLVEYRFLQVLRLKLCVDPDKMNDNLTGSGDLSGNINEPNDLSNNLTGPDDPCYNLTEISELFRLKYFHLDACHMRVKLPTQMQRLKDLVAWEIDAEVTAVPSDIVDLRGLFYLRFPSEAHLPSCIGRMTSLRTLGLFDLSKNSTETLISLGDLTNLQDLRLTCSTLQSDNLEKNLECLGSIIWKLSNIKCVTLVPAISSHVNNQNDAGASNMSTSWHGFTIAPLPPALLQTLELSRRCCIFSNLPKWIKELTKLRILKIALRKVSTEDVVILKGLPSLTALSLFIWTVPIGSIIFDNEGFSVLKYFKFVCGAPRLAFLDGAMPNVLKLKQGFNANRMERYRLDAAGFNRLLSLNEISIKIGGAGTDEHARRSAQSVLTESISNHPGSPIINVKCVDWNFSDDDKKYIEAQKEICNQTSEKQDEHGIQEMDWEEDTKKQARIRPTYMPRQSTLHLPNAGAEIPEKNQVDTGGYGEVDKLCPCITTDRKMLGLLKENLIPYRLRITENRSTAHFYSKKKRTVHFVGITTACDPEVGTTSKSEPVRPRIKIITDYKGGLTGAISMDAHSTKPWILLGHYDGQVSIWNHQNQTRVMAIHLKSDGEFFPLFYVAGAKFIEPLQVFVAHDSVGYIHVYSYEKAKKLQKFRGHASCVKSLAVHPSEPLVLSASDDKLIKLWNWEAGWQCIRTFEGHSSCVYQVKFNPQTAGNTFASCSHDYTIKMWNMDSPTPVASFECDPPFARGLDYFCPGGASQYLVTHSAYEGNERIWDLQSNTCIKCINGLQKLGCNIAVVEGPSGRPILLTVSEDHTVAFCNSTTHRYENRVNFNLGNVQGIAYITMIKSIAVLCDRGIAIMEID